MATLPDAYDRMKQKCILGRIISISKLSLVRKLSFHYFINVTCTE